MTPLATDTEAAAATGDSVTRPARPSERIHAMDAIRGFAVLGILLRNVFVFGMPSAAFALPLLWGGDARSDLYSWAFVELFVDGAMRALFSILFGASALLILDKPEILGLSSADYFYRRLLWLMFFGLIHGYILLSGIDILFVYGAIGLLIFPFRNANPYKLLLAAALIVGISAVATNIDFAVIDEPPQEQATAPTPDQSKDVDQTQNRDESDPSDLNELIQIGASLIKNELIAEITHRRGDYLYNLLYFAEDVFNNHSVDLFKSHLLDVGALFLIGMALFRLGVVTGGRSRAFYAAMLVAGYGIGLTINVAENYPELFPHSSGLESPDWTMFTYDAGRIAIAFGHLALILLIVRSSRLRFVTGLFSSAGRMALSNYVLQTVICTYVFYGFGLGLFGEFSHGDLLAFGFALGMVQLISSHIYLRFFDQGPLEWLIRRLIRRDVDEQAVPATPEKAIVRTS